MRDDEMHHSAAVATPCSQDHESNKHLAMRGDTELPCVDNNGSSPPRAKSTKSTTSLSDLDTPRDDDPVTTTEREFEVSFDEVKIGLSLEVIYANVVRVKDTSGPARACGCIQTGDVLVRVQGRDIAHDRFAHVMHTLKSAPRPLQLQFRRPVPTVELPPNFALDREPRSDNARRHNDVDSVCACHEEEDEDDDDDSNVDTAQDDSCSSSLPGSSASSTARPGKCAKTRPALNEAGSPMRHNLHPDSELRPSSLAAQWKAITDWSFGLAKAPPPTTSLAPPLDDFEIAMLSLRIEPPTASLLPVTNVLPTPGEDGAALVVRWQPCVGAKTYHLQQSRDWPVKIWKQCATTVIQSGGQNETKDGPTETALLECVVHGLDYNRSYVFRVRCALESGACGDFSDASDAVTTTAAPLSAASPVVPCEGAAPRPTPSPPADVALAYHPDFEGDANALSLVVTWTAVPHATTYQVQWMRHGQRLVWRNSPDLSAWEVTKDVGADVASGGRDPLITPCPRPTAMQYTLQGLASGTEYVVRIRAATEGSPPALVWGEFSAWSTPLATIASEEDLAHAQDALARKEAAAAVVEHIKSMATSVKDAVAGSRNPGLFAQVRQLYKS